MIKQTKVYSKNHYSSWRRTLDGYRFKTIDVDCVEIRDGKIKAIIEQTEWKYVSAMLNPKLIINLFERIYAVQVPVYQAIAEAIGVPAYIVVNDEECKNFIVHKMGDEVCNFKIYDREGYLEFLKFDDKKDNICWEV